jgi:hypothetical protein
LAKPPTKPVKGKSSSAAKRTGATPKPNRDRAGLLLAWVALIGLQLAVASPTWYWVSYSFGEAEKQLSVSGFNSWPIVTGEIMFSLVGLGAVLLSRGLVRRFLAWLVATASTLNAIGLLISVLPSLSNRVPPKVNGMIEKASGIVGGAANGSSSAINHYAATSALVVPFAILGLALAALQIWVAVRVPAWNATAGRDKYARAQGADALPKTTTKTNPKAPTKSERKGKGDNIALWDSQR